MTIINDFPKVLPRMHIQSAGTLSENDFENLYREINIFYHNIVYDHYKRAQKMNID